MVSVVISVVTVLLLILISRQGIGTITRAEDEVVEVTVVLLEEAYRLKLATERLVVGSRGYMLTTEQQFLRPWSEGLIEFEQSLAAIDRLDTDPGDRAILQDVQRLKRLYEDYASESMALREAGRSTDALKPLLIRNKEVKDQLMRRLDDLIERRKRALAATHLAVDLAQQRTAFMMNAAALVVVPLLLLGSLLLIWRVVRPLADLTVASQAIAHGDFSARVPKRIDDEFGLAAVAFNSMADRTERAVHDLRQLNADLEAKAALLSTQQQRLEAAHRELTTQHESLAQANEELRQLDRYKDEFLATVSHELRSPLTSVRGYAEILEDGIGGALAEPQQRYVRLILMGVQRV
ncbi:MAG: HAMP domain-containing protein, partial [Candidatus Sericytochromatia bacterium]